MSYSCPICKKSYDKKTDKCRCGFEGVDIAEYYPYFTSEKQQREEYAKESFGIYKFSKRVACGELPYPGSELVLREGQNNETVVYEAVEERGMAYIDCVGTADKPTVADEGVIALRTGLYSLYLNTDLADSRFLDEGHIRMLFIGPDFKGFTEGGMIQYPQIRYIWVDPRNRFFTAENNVLYTNDKKTLVAYARCRPEAEYRVPESVRYIEKYSFFYTTDLEKLYLPKKTEISEGAFHTYAGKMPEIIYY